MKGSFLLPLLLFCGLDQFSAKKIADLGNIFLSPQANDNSIDLTVNSAGIPALTGQLGISLPHAVGSPVENCNEDGSECTYVWDDFAQVVVTRADEDTNDNCAKIVWSTNYAKRLEDCFDLEDGVHWYGGGGPTYTQKWPIETVSRPEAPVVAGDSMGGDEYGAVTESYWLLSSGVAIHVDEDVALFMSVNSVRKNKICFIAQDEYPFLSRKEVSLKYEICTGSEGDNFKDVHQRAFLKYYEKPSGIPDERMMIEPFWSTWAEYKENVNETLVLELATNLMTKGFQNSSHIEIDDDWETCYGESVFKKEKFPDPAAMTAKLRSMGFRTTLWTHPFINYECPSFTTALQRGYFVKDEKSRTGLTSWWQGQISGLIDFTNDAAVKWWSGRLEKLKTEYGIDSFKFDAGEVSRLPYSFKLTGDPNLTPNLITTKFVGTAGKFGGMTEVRVGHQNQREAIFMRILDRDSRWGYDNGLQSLIPCLLDFGLKGYPFVLPDMVGGNAYNGKPSKELYIRWTQANAFMPSIQFSLLPWKYDEETIEIVKQVLALRAEFADHILASAEEAVEDGSPMNRPMWWSDPLDHETYTIDNQYMLGSDILVAPVLVEDAKTRDVYLPNGYWSYRKDGETLVYGGPQWLKNFPAPLQTLPFFVRVPNDTDASITGSDNGSSTPFANVVIFMGLLYVALCVAIF